MITHKTSIKHIFIFAVFCIGTLFLTTNTSEAILTSGRLVQKDESRITKEEIKDLLNKTAKQINFTVQITSEEYKDDFTEKELQGIQTKLNEYTQIIVKRIYQNSLLLFSIENIVSKNFPSGNKKHFIDFHKETKEQIDSLENIFVTKNIYKMLLENKKTKQEIDFTQDQVFVETKLQLSALVSKVFSFREIVLAQYIKLKTKKNKY